VIAFVCATCPPRYNEYIQTVGMLPLMALLVVCCSHGSSGVVTLLGASPFYELGNVSYITYIVQAPLWHFYFVLSDALAGYSPAAKQVAAWQFLLFVPILIGASFVISRYVEKPAQRLLVQFRTPARRAPGVQEAVPEFATTT
jgi:peptidoglycan/LPS O-acetylase OafA/YrhL